MERTRGLHELCDFSGFRPFLEFGVSGSGYQLPPLELRVKGLGSGVLEHRSRSQKSGTS